MYNFFIPPQAVLQKKLTPSPVDHPPTAGLKMTNPLGSWNAHVHMQQMHDRSVFNEKFL